MTAGTACVSVTAGKPERSYLLPRDIIGNVNVTPSTFEKKLKTF